MTSNRYIMSPEQMRSVWQNADWHKVIDYFGLEINKNRCRNPNEIWIKSPFTNEDNASLHLDLSKNIFKDFSSGKGAGQGILTFCQDLLAKKGLKLNCYRVAQWMLQNGISDTVIGEFEKKRTHYTVIKKRDEKEKKEVLVNLPIRVDLRQWLDSNHPQLSRRGISPATCKYLGCGYLPITGIKRSPLNGRIVFQIRGISHGKSTILTHVGRALTQKQQQQSGKYWSYPFRKGLEIYNQDKLAFDCQARSQVKQSGIILVEGFFDVASLVEAGCLNAGALMGAYITRMQIDRLKFICSHTGAKRIMLFFDRDEAGSAGRQRADSLLKANGFEVDAFEWDQKFYISKGSWVKIPKEIKDAGDMSVRQLHWLRKNGKI